MAAVTICSDFGAEKIVCHCFHCFRIYLPWSDGTGCHDLSFFYVLSFTRTLSLSSFTFIKRLFNSSLFFPSMLLLLLSLQLCPTMCHPIESSLPGATLSGILQARTLEWVAISFSNTWKWKVKVKSLSCVWLFATPWTAAYQAPLSMGFSRQEYWSGLPLPSQVLKV